MGSWVQSSRSNLAEVQFNLPRVLRRCRLPGLGKRKMRALFHLRLCFPALRRKKKKKMVLCLMTPKGAETSNPHPSPLCTAISLHRLEICMHHPSGSKFFFIPPPSSPPSSRIPPLRSYSSRHSFFNTPKVSPIGFMARLCSARVRLWSE